MGCAGSSMCEHFHWHTLSYQRSSSHHIPAQRVCEYTNPRKHVMRVRMSATWRIRPNDACLAVATITLAACFTCVTRDGTSSYRIDVRNLSAVSRATNVTQTAYRFAGRIKIQTACIYVCEPYIMHKFRSMAINWLSAVHKYRMLTRKSVSLFSPLAERAIYFRRVWVCN